MAAKISGRVGAGSFLVFNRIEQPTDRNEVELALRVISETDLKLNGEFSDWKFDDTGLVDVGARFNSLSGQVEVRHEQEANGWKSAKLETIMYVDDHVKTSEESEAILSFADMQTFQMKEETEIALLAPPGKGNKMAMVYGKIKANIRKMMLDGSMEIDMSQAVAGIKGTRFILTETGTESKVEVTEGTVAFTSKATGNEVLVTAGEAVVATAQGLGEKTTFDPTLMDAELVEETKENVPAPSPALTDTAETPANTALDGDDSEYNYGFWIALLAAIIGGGWVVKRKKEY